VAEIADIRVIGRASIKDATRACVAAARRHPCRRGVRSERAVEPNGYYLPEWALAVNACAWPHRRIRARCLSDASSVHDRPARMIGLLPAVSLWRAYQLPLPGWQVRSPMARFARRRSMAVSPRTPRSD
jgi:hypothetical protein